MVYVGIVIMMALLETFLVYPVPPQSLGEWDAAAQGVEDVLFEAADGTQLHGFYASYDSPKGHVLFCHGNGEHVGFLGEAIVELSRELEVSVFAFDYRGYGRSDGKPNEPGVLADGEAAQRWLANRAGVQPDQVILYGRSLGGAVAVHLADSIGTRALVVERTFDSMVEIGARQYPWLPVRWIMRNRYPSADKIRSFDGPLLQLHGSDDPLVPIASAQALFAACPSEHKEFVTAPGMGHNGATPLEFMDKFKKLLLELDNQQ